MFKKHLLKGILLPGINSYIGHPKFNQYLFIVVVAALSSIMLYAGWGTGFHNDEIDQNTYGKAVIKYYASAGKDTSFLHLKQENGLEIPPVIRTYGGLFEMFLNTVTKILRLKYEYDVRHLIIQLCGLLSMLLAAWIVKEITNGYKSALIAFMLMYFTPFYFGHCLMNSKDIPFAMGYAMVLFLMIKFFKNFNYNNYRPTVLLASAIGFSISVRIGGLIVYLPLVLFYVIYYRNDPRFKINWKVRQQVWQYTLHVLLLGLIPVVFVFIAYPVVHKDPWTNFMLCFDTAKKFPQRIPLNFNGELIHSLMIPKSFIPKWLSISLPEIALVLILFGLFYYFLFFVNKKDSRFIALVVFFALFPLAYSIYKNVAFYTAWRHLLFLYPAAAVVASYSFEYVKHLKKTSALYCLAVLLACLIHPIQFMIKYHPLQYVYFNKISGGFKHNYNLYETDGWQISVKQAMEWISQQKDVKSGKPIVIGTNAYSAIEVLVKHYYKLPHVKVIECGYKIRNSKKWDYLIINVNFMPPMYISTVYPNLRSVKKIEIESRPLCMVVRDTIRHDYLGFQALTKDDYRKADSHFNAAILNDPYSEYLNEMMLMCKLAVKDFDQSYQHCLNLLEIYPENAVFLYFKSVCLMSQGDFERALSTMVSAADYGYKLDAHYLTNLLLLCQKTKNTSLEKIVLDKLANLKEE